jgi:hypothetical protein
MYTKDLPEYHTEKPYIVLTHMNETHSRTNMDWYHAAPEVMHDIRGSEKNFTLDTHGFGFLNSPTTFEQWNDNELTEKIYLPEVIQILKDNVEDVSHIEIFDWRVRPIF